MGRAVEALTHRRPNESRASRQGRRVKGVVSGAGAHAEGVPVGPFVVVLLGALLSGTVAVLAAFADGGLGRRGPRHAPVRAHHRGGVRGALLAAGPVRGAL
jgi:hypothetical protein